MPFMFHRLFLHIILVWIDEAAKVVDIGVNIRHTLSARKNPGSNTDLYAVADERTTAVTLEMQIVFV